MNLQEILHKLNGSIEPVGCTAQDEARFENLKRLCELVNKLVGDIDNVAYKYQASHEFSVKRASDYASSFLTNTLGIN